MERSFRILLVEDNSDDELLTLRSLRKLGDDVQIEVARDGQLALNRILDPAGPALNLVLLDLHLPKINGIEILQAVRANEATMSIPVVVLTSSEEPEDIRASYLQHANSCIRKPVSLQEFSDAVQSLGLYWRDLNLKPSEPF